MADELVTEMQDLLKSPRVTEGKTPTTDSGTALAQEDRKSPLITKSTETDEPLIELKIAQGKGFGLFATRSIIRGTRIIEEAPLLAVSPRDGSMVSLSHFVAAFRALNHGQRAKLFELHREDKTSLGQQLTASHDSEITDALAVFTANCVAMGESGQYGSGLFEHYSRINHACKPNVHNSYNPTLQKLTVHAVQHINKGEEILTSYIDGTCRTRQQRQQKLDNWAFVCGCKCCTGPNAAASDQRRKIMLDKDQLLALYARGLSRLLGFPVPRNAQGALKVAEDLLELYRSEGIADFSLATLYRECSKYSLESGHHDKAVNYAKKERDVELYCIGTETAHLKKDLKGAEFWLEHVLRKRERATSQRQDIDKALEEKLAREMAPSLSKKKKGGKGKKK